MNINALRAFVKLAENDCDFSIHRELGMARSSLWTLVDDLEKETAMALIIRKKRHNSFTEEAERFLPFAREIIRTFEDGIQEAKSDFDEEPSGDILIATTLAVSHTFLMPSIKKFNRQYPKIKVKVIADDYISSATEWIADIIFRPMDMKDHIDLKWYLPNKSGLYASKNYITKYGLPETAEDLSNHYVIGYGESVFSYFPDVDWHIKGRWPGASIPKLSTSITINSTMSIYLAARESIGICSAMHHANVIYGNSGNPLIRVLPNIDGPTVNTGFFVKRNMGSRTKKNVQIFQVLLEKYLKSIDVNLMYDSFGSVSSEEKNGKIDMNKEDDKA